MEVPGLNTAMLVALGENDVKTVEDLADCATDDLAGWNERQEKETTHYDGFLEASGLTRTQCEDLILAARVKAGWIDEADLVADEEEAEGEEVDGEVEGESGAEAAETTSEGQTETETKTETGEKPAEDDASAS
jgi:N utilization substance protein A